MATLRLLANSRDSEYSLEQWIELAKVAGVNPDPDAEFDIDTLLQLRAYKVQYEQKKQMLKEERSRKDALALKSMDNLICNNYVFVDSSCLLVPAAEKAFQRMVPFMTASSKKFNIPQSCVLELINIARDRSDTDKSELARKHLMQLQTLESKNLLLTRKTNGTENSCTQDLYTMCAHHRMQASLLVITQDEKLAADLIALNSQRSANGHTITVKKINKYGYLSNTIDKPQVSKPFTLCTVVRSERDKQIPVNKIPGVRDLVYTSPDVKGEIVLIEQMGEGGEGIIYKTNTPYVAKIYKKECCSEYRVEKLTKMIEANLEYNKGICFPVSLLYNQYGQFVGYLMPEAKGYSIQSSIFRKPLFLKKLPGWKKEDLVQCAITILNKIKYLHANNILIGDINPNNFLIVSPTEVYLVDTDSFQINDLPCPVGFPLFTAPEIHMKQRQGVFNDYSELLRTKENEYFAVATLIFMILMPGKPPYTQQGGEDIVENILEMHFPYAVGERRGENVPDGTWRFIWSHLTRKMKENFLKVFNKEDGNSEFNIAERLTVEQWESELLVYKRIIQTWKRELAENPLSLEFDPLSLELYPTRLKHQPGKQYVICRGTDCNREYAFDDPALKAGFCPECQRKGTSAKCWHCNKEFIFNNFEKYYLGMTSAPRLCPECRKTKDEVVYRAQCSNDGCFNNIIYTKAELANARFKAAEKKYPFAFPKICKSCKEKGIRPRSGRSNGTSHKSSSNHNGDTPKNGSAPSSKNSSGTKGCFITTAVCLYLGKPDDCEELSAFRMYRDTWLAHQPEGKTLIEEYYRIAPELVRRMNESSDYEMICQTLWDKYLVPCHQMILGKQFNECKTKYMDMVYYLNSILSN